MSAELTLLLWSLPVYALYFCAQTFAYRMHQGWLYSATARDDEKPPGMLQGRAERALRNFFETYPAFVVLMLVAHLADRGDPLVFWGAVIYLVARLVYLPLYLAGTFAIRSVVWWFVLLGLILSLAGILF